MLDGAALVLTATRGHRDRVVAMRHDLVRRTFTWRELSWLSSGIAHHHLSGTTSEQRLESLLALVARRRGHLVVPPERELDVADPVGRPARAVRRAADQIVTALSAVLPLLQPTATGA